jgi:hypothetical protein
MVCTRPPYDATRSDAALPGRCPPGQLPNWMMPEVSATVIETTLPLVTTSLGATAGPSGTPRHGGASIPPPCSLKWIPSLASLLPLVL